MADSKADELGKLAELRDQGVLTEAEFLRQKKEVLRSSAFFGASGFLLSNRVRAAVVGGSALTVLLVVLILVAFLPSSTPPKGTGTVEVQTASVTTSQVDQAINWAKSHLGQNFDDGLCLNFVYEAWKSAGVDIGGYFPSDDPVIYWAHNYGGFTEHASPGSYNDPPAGALVFWGANRWNSDGHVAMSLGNNQVISTSAYPYAGGVANSPLVFTFTLSNRSPGVYNYLGWILPGNTVSIPQTSPTPAPSLQAQGSAAGPAQGGSVQLQGGSGPAQGSSPHLQGGGSLPSGATIIVPSSPQHSNSSPSPATTVAPQPSPTPAPTTTTTQPPTPPPPATYSETTGGVTHTWTDYNDAGGTEGQSIPAYTTVQISCKVQGFKVADGNTWWYRIASGPWNNQFYASADAFYNNGQTSGSLQGTPFVDNNVPNC